MASGVSEASNFIGCGLSDIPTPALLVDLDALEYNIGLAGRIASEKNVAYKPHCKGHKSPFIAHKQLAAGAAGICCAKLSEAQVMIEGGVTNVSLTSPVIKSGMIRKLAALARHSTISVVVDDIENIRSLEDACSERDSRLRVIVEVDVGQRRCGVAGGDDALRLIEAVESGTHLRFGGLQGYQGKMQLEPDYRKRREGVQTALDRLRNVADAIVARGTPVNVLTGGGTGSMAIDLELNGLNELQPGSYTFMDARYTGIQWSSPTEPPPFRASLTVLTTVLSTRSAGIAVVDAGWKALSSDGGKPCAVMRGAEFGFAGDEHGVMTFDGQCPMKVGDISEIVPSHCDTTVNLYDYFVGVRGGAVEIVWQVAARGRAQ